MMYHIKVATWSAVHLARSIHFHNQPLLQEVKLGDGYIHMHTHGYLYATIFNIST